MYREVVSEMIKKFTVSQIFGAIALLGGSFLIFLCWFNVYISIILSISITSLILFLALQIQKVYQHSIQCISENRKIRKNEAKIIDDMVIHISNQSPLIVHIYSEIYKGAKRNKSTSKYKFKETYNNESSAFEAMQHYYNISYVFINGSGRDYLNGRIELFELRQIGSTVIIEFEYLSYKALKKFFGKIIK